MITASNNVFPLVTSKKASYSKWVRAIVRPESKFGGSFTATVPRS